MRALWILALLQIGCGFEPECGSNTQDGTSFDGNMCESRLVRELRVSSSFAIEQQEAIMLAGSDWSEATSGRVTLRFVMVDDDADIYPASVPGSDRAQQWSSTGAIEAEPDVEPDYLRLIIAHELGHSFGLGHVADVGQNMHPYSTATIAPADVEHFNRLYANRR